MASVALACVLVPAAACGGGSDDSGPPDLDAVATATLPAELPEPIIIGGGAVLPGGGATYVIRSGDTFSSIASAYDVTVEELVAANPGVDPTGLHAGDVIRLPEAADTTQPPPEEEPTTAPEPAPTEEPAPTSTPEPAPTNTPSALGQTYIVKEGDIPVNIAAQFGITVEALFAANPGVTATNLQVGQVLIIPPAPPAGG